MGVGGTKGGQSQQAQSSTMTIPPEVLARYNAVNARAEDVAQQPFQAYGGEFVSPINATQQGGIDTISNAGSTYAPYANRALTSLDWGSQAALPYFGQAASSIGQGVGLGAAGASAGMGSIAGGLETFGKALGTLDTAGNTITQAQAQASPYNSEAMGYITGGLGAAQPYNAQAGQGIGSALSGAQPYQQVATGLGLAGTQAVDPGQLQVGQYMSPYQQSVINATLRPLQQQQRMEQQNLTGDSILNGSWGGDRAGISKAVLAGQQDMATGQVVSTLNNQNYAQALAAAQQQQGVGLGAAQANRAALGQGAQTLAGIGQQGYQQGLGAAQAYQGLGNQYYAQGVGAGQATAGVGNQVFGQGRDTAQTQIGIGEAQGNIGQMQVGAGQAQAGVGNMQFQQGLGAAGAYQNVGQGTYGLAQNYATTAQGLGTAAQGNQLAQGQAQLGAGTVQQQTGQAFDSAQYQQFLQQQGYPFQVAQFLSNIATGTGALSGSTTQTAGYAQTPQPFFSDERLKEGVRVIGKTQDGIPIIIFRYKGSPHTQIGMKAQDVEEKRPEAVGLAGGYKTVDYDAATRGKHAGGGLAAAGGAVANDNWGEGFDAGGTPDALEMQRRMYRVPGAPGDATMDMHSAPGFGSVQHALMLTNDLMGGSANGATGNNSGTVGAGDTGVSGTGGVGGNASSDAGVGGSAAAGVGGDDGGTYAGGGSVYDPSMSDVLALHQAMYPGAGGRGAMDQGQGPRGLKLWSPSRGTLQGPKVPPMDTRSGDPTFRSAVSTAGDLTKAGQGVSDLYRAGKEAVVGAPAKGSTPATGGLAGQGGSWDPQNGWFGRQVGASTTGNGLGAANTNTPITSQELPPPPDTSSASSASSGALRSLPDESQSLAPDALDPSIVDDAFGIFARRGGRIKRAVGGMMPYAQDEGYIPDDIYDPIDTAKLRSEQDSMAPKMSQQQQHSGSSGGSGGSGIGDAIGLAAKIAPLAMMFLKRGGRVGYEDGGSPSDEEPAAEFNRTGSIRKGLPPYENVVPFPTKGLDPRSDNLPDPEDFNERHKPPPGPGPSRSTGEDPWHLREFTGLRNDPYSRAPQPGLGAAATAESYKPEDIDTNGTGRYVDTPPVTPTGVNPAVAKAAIDQTAATVPATPSHALNPASNYPVPQGFKQPGGQDISHEPDAVFGRMLRQESPQGQFDTRTGAPVRSPKGATGASQVMPQTGPEAAKLAGLPWNPELFSRSRTGDPVQDKEAQDYNLALGKAYYQEQHRAFGDPYVAAAAYNAGPEAVRRAQLLSAQKGGSYLQYLPKETQDYVFIVSGQTPQRGGSLALNAPAPSVPADQGLGAAAAQAAPPRDFMQRTGDWLDRNERPVMAGLAFLGNMLASPSKTLVGAAGAGLAAAAPQYLASGFRQQELSQGQQRVDITRNAQLIGLYNQLRAMVANQIKQDGRADPGTLAQMNNLAAQIGQGTASGVTAPPVGSAPGSPQTPSGGPPMALSPTSAPSGPVTRAALPPPAQAPSEPIAAPQPAPGPRATEPASMRMPIANVNDPAFLKQLDPNFNPQVLLQRASAMAGVDPAQADSLRAEARAAQDRISQTGMGVGPGGAQVPVPGWGEVKAARDRVADNAAWVQQQQPIFQQRQAMRHNIEKIADTVKNFEPGQLNALWSDMQATLKGVGVPLRNTPTMNAEAYQKFVKEAASVVMGNPTGDSKTDQARELLREGFANPHLQPGAVRSILGQSLGYLDYADDYYRDVTQKLPHAAHLNRNLRTLEFDAEHPIANYVEQRTKDTPVRGDVPERLTDFKPGHAYVLEPNDPVKFGIGPKLPGPTTYRYVGMVDGKPRFERVK